MPSSCVHQCRRYGGEGEGASWLAQPSKRGMLALAALHCDEDVDLVAFGHLAALPLAARHDRLVQSDRDARGILLTGLVGNDLGDREALVALSLFLIHRVVHSRHPFLRSFSGRSACPLSPSIVRSF